MKMAGIFPGQGSEYPGMLKCIEEYGVTAKVFSVINENSGRDIYRTALEGREDELKEPLAAQLSVFGTSACYWHMLKDSMDFHALAGHSLGFYSALYAAGSLSLDNCVKTIIKVHETIDEISGSGAGLMAVIIGLKAHEVDKICSDAGDVYVSNINSATQIVISGTECDVKKACGTALSSGALNARVLSIPYPLHSPLMEGIEGRLRHFISKLELKKPSIPVISHIDAGILDIDSIVDVLSGQLSKKVMWRDTIKYLAGAGIAGFLEIGPSDVLSKLVRWIERDAESLRAEEVLNCPGV
ncbi:MAG: ACP S-malonyltransferase [Nitrospirota bacterium]